jgi:hypothetical protein
MNFSKTALANVPGCASPSHLFLIYFSSISYLSLIHFLSISYLSLIYSFPNPVSSLAGRTPPYGGIARPTGKHSRHKGALCPLSADFSRTE